jgi:hypothetical protein
MLPFCTPKPIVCKSRPEYNIPLADQPLASSGQTLRLRTVQEIAQKRLAMTAMDLTGGDGCVGALEGLYEHRMVNFPV